MYGGEARNFSRREDKKYVIYCTRTWVGGKKKKREKRARDCRREGELEGGWRSTGS
jgi:hypothetical protein